MDWRITELEHGCRKVEWVYGDHVGIIEYLDQNGMYHNLEGYAIKHGAYPRREEYCIHGKNMSKEEWEKHPLVLARKREKIIDKL